MKARMIPNIPLELTLDEATELKRILLEVNFITDDYDQTITSIVQKITDARRAWFKALWKKP